MQREAARHSPASPPQPAPASFLSRTKALWQSGRELLTEGGTGFWGSHDRGSWCQALPTTAHPRGRQRCGTNTDVCRGTEPAKAHKKIHARYRAEMTSRLRSLLLMPESTGGSRAPNRKNRLHVCTLRGLQYPILTCNIHLYKHVFIKTHIN